MDNNNFFNKPQENMQQDPVQTDQAQEEPTGISLGDKTYTQEELQEAVGFRERAKELEEKWNTKIDRLMPAYSEVTNERAELQKRVDELEAKVREEIDQKVSQGEQLSPEEEERLIKQQAKKFGLLTNEEFANKYQEFRQKEELENQAKQMISQATEYVEKQAGEGKPKIDVKNLVEYMDDNGISNYEAAYKLKFEKELDDWKMKQLSANKPNGFYTQSQTNAGGKMPEEKKITNENLGAAIQDVLNRPQ